MPKSKNKTIVDEVVRDQMTTVFGDSGTERFRGYFLEEPNFEWRDSRRVQNVEEMRRSDASVKGVLNALKAPILSTKWHIEGEDEEIVAFIKENLFGMERCWLDFLRESFTFLDFGFSVFEIVYEIRDGRICLKDLAPRIQSSIERWQLTNGEPGVYQRLRNGDAKGAVAEIPMEKLVVFTNDKEGDDITGQSVLRAAWKHYKYKDLLYRFQGISAERYGAGVPVVTLPEEYGEADKEKAEELASEIRTNEKGFMVLPHGYEVSILVPNGNPQGAAMESSIAHHSKMILSSVLASFLGLGTDSSSGSFALSKDQSSFFLKHVEDKASYFAEQITERVIKKLVLFNFGENAACPKLKFSPLGDIDFGEMATTMKTLVDSGLVETSPKMKQFTRNIFKLPEISDEEVAEEELEHELEEMNDDIMKDELGFTEEPEIPIPENQPNPPEEEMPEEKQPQE